MDNQNVLYNEQEKIIDNILKTENRHVIHGMFIINLDNFFVINNALGVEKGNEILLVINEVIKNFFKGTDVVAQLKFGEYAVLIQNPRTINDIERICDKILTNIADLSFDGISITASIGIAVYPFHGKTYDDLKLNAYQALTRAKSNGKNCYRIYEAALTKANFSSFLFGGDYDDFDYRNLNESAWDRYFMDVSMQLFHYDSNIYACLNSLLEIFCLYHGFNRGYIVTNSEHSLYDKKRLDFSMPGYELPANDLIDVLRNDLVLRLYDEKGKFGIVRTDLPSEDIEIMNYMQDTNVSELLFFAIIVNDHFMGGIVYENVEDCYSDMSSEQMLTISNQVDSILTYSLLSKKYRSSKELFSKIEMFEGMGCAIYIIDYDSHVVEYMNDYAIKSAGLSMVGKKCYELIREKECVCSNCPLSKMNPDDVRSNQRLEYVNHSTGKWGTNMYSWLSPRDNKGKVLLISMDIDNTFEVAN